MTPTQLVCARYAPGRSQSAIAVSLRRCLRALGHPPDIHRFPWWQLARAEVLTMLARLTHFAPSVQRHSRVALTHVLRECRRLRLLSQRRLDVLLDDWPKVIGSREPVGRALTPAELARLFRVAQEERPRRAARDTALLAVMAGTGCRRAEAAFLTVADIDRATHRITIHGKANVVRSIPLLVPSLWAILEHWLALRGDWPGPLFLRLSRWDTPSRRGLAICSVNGVLQRLTMRAGVRCTPHDLRRTGITWLLDAGTDLDAVQHWAGHRHVQTTLAYRRPARDPVVTAAESLGTIMAAAV